MAALGKIRSKGVTLVIIIALGLFAFIAEEAFRSCNGIKGEKSQQIGEVLGQKVSVQDFQKLVQEVEDAQKLLAGNQNLTEQQQNQLRDQVWQQYVGQKILENDAEKVGLTVTDGEVENVLKQGVNPILQRDIPIPQFYNQQTGRFDYSTVQQFLAQYNKEKESDPQASEQLTTMYNLWLYCEKQVRNDLLQEKYNGLLQACVLSNKVEAKMAFNDQNEEATIQLATLPYSSIKDASVKLTEDDLKAKYDELKAAFKQAVETRDLKYVDFQIKASAADRKAINKEMAGYQKELAAATDPAQVVSHSGSTVPYLGVPVSAKAFPQDIAAKVDSAEVGTSAVFETTGDNTLNIVRILAKASLPDSVQYRQIQVVANTPDEARTKADSISKALAGGADFEALAKKYGQTGEKAWFTGRDYEGASTMNQDSRDMINAFLNGEVNSVQNVALTQGNVILQVLDRRAMTEKYTAAVIKKVIDFSKSTRSTAYNKFSEFVANSADLASLQKNAKKYGYTVQDLKDLSTSTHTIGQVGGSGIKDALKWVFSAKEGEMSPLYEAGDNDHLLVVYLEKIHPAGYRPLDDPQVKEIVRREALKDKKAEMLIAKLKGVNSIAGAKAKGAEVSTIDKVTFAQPVSVPSVQAIEPALSGAVAATAAGKFVSHPVKGNAGVYVFQVVKKTKGAAKYNEQMMMQNCIQQAYQVLSAYQRDLYMAANVVDNRYLFF